MDLSPEALQSVKFRGAVRGYHTGEVDEFIEKVAAGVRELLDQLRKANERAAKTDTGPAADTRPSDDAVRRTLMHAQKLADAVISEARQEAAKVTKEAEEQARRLRVKTRDEAAAHVAKTEAARAEAERLVAEAEADRAKARSEVNALVERAAADIDRDLLSELDRLTGVRASLQRDCAALEAWLEAQRQSLRSMLTDAISVLDQSALPLDPPVEVSEVDTQLRLPGTDPDEQPPVAEAQPSVDETSGAEGVAEPVTEPDAANGADDTESAAEAPVWAARATPSAAAAPPASKPKKTAEELSDDDFLAELKRAAESTEPLGENL